MLTIFKHFLWSICDIFKSFKHFWGELIIYQTIELFINFYLNSCWGECGMLYY